MSHNARQCRSPMNDAPSARARGQVRLWPLAVGLAIAASVTLVAYLLRNDDDPTPGEPNASIQASPRPAAPSPPREADASPTQAVSKSAEYSRLIGRWVRTDTPYVIEIKGVGDDGKLRVAYYNPRPINVSAAEARRENGRLLVFVELRDKNYPGSNYTLAYDAEKDILRGVYFHATLRKQYSIAFRRTQAVRP